MVRESLGEVSSSLRSGNVRESQGMSGKVWEACNGQRKNSTFVL